MQKVNLFLSAILLTAMLLTSCGGVGTYKEVTISDQLWMKENLNVNKFRNGDIIPEAKTNAEWIKAGKNKQPAWCYYDNEPVNGEKYGKLYNWYAVNDPRSLAPKGYHIPTIEEWTKLTHYLGGIDSAGTKMKSTSGWYSNGNGTNSSGFSGLPGGCRYSLGSFGGVDYFGWWWSPIEHYTDFADNHYLYYHYVKLSSTFSYKNNGFSVRCIKD